jgi:prenyl protein peptidase
LAFLLSSALVSKRPLSILLVRRIPFIKYTRAISNQTSTKFSLALVRIAHLHHGYESFVKKGRTRQAAIQAALIALVQLTYTSLFGWFATFLFLRTSSLLAPCLCHSFCNLMGFPDISNIQYYGRWKIWIYLAFVLGIVLFAGSLGPLTNPALYRKDHNSVY